MRWQAANASSCAGANKGTRGGGGRTRRAHRHARPAGPAPDPSTWTQILQAKVSGASVRAIRGTETYLGCPYLMAALGYDDPALWRGTTPEIA